MTINATLPADLLAALDRAKRTPGWNNRKLETTYFDLPWMRASGHCRVYVVPAKIWTYWRLERRTNQRCVSAGLSG